MQGNMVFVKLRDRGTSFYDSSQGKGVVADKIALLTKTAYVSSFITGGQLIEVPDEEGKAYLAAQGGTVDEEVAEIAENAGGDGKKAASTEKKAEATAPAAKPDAKATPAKKAATAPAKKAATAPAAKPDAKATPAKKAADLTSEDDEDEEDEDA